MVGRRSRWAAGSPPRVSGRAAAVGAALAAVGGSVVAVGGGGVAVGAPPGGGVDAPQALRRTGERSSPAYARNVRRVTSLVDALGVSDVTALLPRMLAMRP